MLLPDMLMVDRKPCLNSLVDIHDRHGGNVVALQKCDPDEAHKFGIVSLKPTAEGPLVNGLIEKPAPGTASTNLYMSGRYVLQPEIFGILENQEPGAGGEIQLTDALIELMKTQEIRPFEFTGRTFDCGSPAGFVAANLHLALARPDIGDALAGRDRLDRSLAHVGTQPRRSGLTVGGGGGGGRSLVGESGDARSRAIHPASTTHSQLSAEEQFSTSVSEGYVRLSASSTSTIFWPIWSGTCSLLAGAGGVAIPLVVEKAISTPPIRGRAANRLQRQKAAIRRG